MPDITFLRSNSLENGKQVLSNAEQQCDLSRLSERNNDMSLHHVPEVSEPLATTDSDGFTPLSVETNFSRPASQPVSPVQSCEQYPYPMYPMTPGGGYMVAYQPPPVFYQLMTPPVFYQPVPQSIVYLNEYTEKHFMFFDDAFKKHFSQFWDRYGSNWDMNEIRSPPLDRSRWMIQQYAATVNHICKNCGLDVPDQISKINFWYCFNWSEKAGLLCYKTYNKSCPNCQSPDSLCPIWTTQLVNQAMETVSNAVSQNIYGKRVYSKSSRTSSRTSSICSPTAE